MAAHSFFDSPYLSLECIDRRIKASVGIEPGAKSLLKNYSGNYRKCLSENRAAMQSNRWPCVLILHWTFGIFPFYVYVKLGFIIAISQKLPSDAFKVNMSFLSSMYSLSCGPITMPELNQSLGLEKQTCKTTQPEYSKFH